jgi:hypothetical protein
MRQPSSWILNFSTISNYDFIPYWQNNFQTTVSVSRPDSIKQKTKSTSTSYKFACPYSHLMEFIEIFNVNFIRKEKVYTKLKYSRTPAYDIISGGVAALFAGFLGFLICEKFGFELLDSADFFFALLYLIIAIFPLRMLLKICRNNEGKNSAFEIKLIFEFFWIILQKICKLKK